MPAHLVLALGGPLMPRVTTALILALLIPLAGCAETASTNAPATSEPDAPTSSTPTSTTVPTPDTTAPDVAPNAPPAPVVRVHYVDVGQGDGTVWELPSGGVILYDCGLAPRSGERARVVAYLQDELGLAPGSVVHALIVSHGHADHVGGCASVLETYRVLHVYDAWYEGEDAPASYRAFQAAAASSGAVVHTLDARPGLPSNAVFRQGSPIDTPAAVAASILWPPSWQGAHWRDIAASGIVARAAHGDVAFCFQGDIETKQESVLASRSDVACDVYLAGHHGSKHASSTTWLERMSPSIAIVSFGENSYGHPTPEALCRIQRAGATVYATHRAGTVVVESDGATARVTKGTPETRDYCATGASYWTTPQTQQDDELAPAPAAGAVNVTAAIADSTPCQNSKATVTVTVTRDGAPAAGLPVTSKWHYKSTTSEETGTTGENGVAVLERSVGRASTDHFVRVVITVDGVTAETGFQPTAC